MWKTQIGSHHLMEKLIQYFCIKHFQLFILKQLGTQMPGWA